LNVSTKVHGVTFQKTRNFTFISCHFKTLLRWAGQIARMGKKRGVYKILVEKPDGKGTLGKTRA
jgi:hypothetical protein